MNRQGVSSSNIASIGYDETIEILEVEFNDSAVYQYLNVPISIFEALMSAPSQGVFFNANIRDQFATERL